MKEFKNKREQAEAEFIGFMEQTIWNCARNATRKAYAAELRNSGISLETLNERNYMEYLTSEDEHECEDCYGILNFQIPINSELVNMLFDGLTEREKQALILKVVLELEYEDIGKIMGIDPMRAKDYKYQGLRKARKKKNGEKNKVDYDVIVAATKGNMVAIGVILESFSGLIDKAVYCLGSQLPEECRRECKQEVMMDLVKKIQTRFTV